MDAIHGILCALLLPLEVACLFAIWRWRWRSGSAACLGLAIAWAALAIAALVALPAAYHATIFLGMAGMYIFSGLAWTWWADGLSPSRWGRGEALVAGIATALFSIAAAQGR